MAESHVEGYPEDRFEVAVNKSFQCPICMNVLKDPVQCQNEHIFCSPCITKHLNENSKTCPICVEKLTTETLSKAPRIVTDYLSSLRIRCDYAKEGCHELVELGNLETHVANCSYSPLLRCSNAKCKVVVSNRNKQHHETEVCEYRNVVCEDCEEEMLFKRYKKHGCLLSKEVDKLKLDVVEMKDQFVQMQSSQDELLKEMRKLMSEVKAIKNSMQTLVNPSSSAIKEDIVVLGGINKDDMVPLNTVETFNWDKMSWTSLPPMQQGRFSATSGCYQGKLLVTGGSLSKHGTAIDEAEEFWFHQTPGQWLSSPVKLPYKCHGHKTVIYNNCLLLVGGYKKNRHCSDAIHEVLLEPPYKRIGFRIQMPQPISYHGMEIFNDEILIVGGSITGYLQGIVDKVLLYNLSYNNCKEMTCRLPFAMCDMATVKWGDDSIIIIGGTESRGEQLNTVFMYNYKEGSCEPLPPMKYKRAESAAVVSGNAIVVMGGYNKEQGCLNSVEFFTFENYAWQDLPPMSERRNKVTAVVKTC